MLMRAAVSGDVRPFYDVIYLRRHGLLALLEKLSKDNHPAKEQYALLCWTESHQLDAARAPTYSLLHVAAACGHTAVVRALVKDGGMDPNVGKDQGFTPLHAAASYGRERVAYILINSGADPDAKYRTETSHCTALHLAVRYGHMGTTMLLAHQGCSGTVRDEQGRTPGQLAEVMMQRVPSDERFVFAFMVRGLQMRFVAPLTPAKSALTASLRRCSDLHVKTDAH